MTLQVAIEQLQSELEAAQSGEDEAREAAQKVCTTGNSC